METCCLALRILARSLRDENDLCRHLSGLHDELKSIVEQFDQEVAAGIQLPMDRSV